MHNHLRVEGTWPGAIDLRAGWFHARARPWNDEVPAPMVRLNRGGADFLTSVADKLVELGGDAVYSPALYAGATGVWRRSGFEQHEALQVMERALHRDTAAAEGRRGARRGSSSPSTNAVRMEMAPDWDQILAIDRSAFEGFWEMSRLGLVEAHQTNRSTTLLVTGEPERLTGYAIVGSQWGTTYLHRIAVQADNTGMGVGTALLTAAIRWGAGSGGRTMILNVRPENHRAKRLYERLGFGATGTSLQVLRYRS